MHADIFYTSKADNPVLIEFLDEEFPNTPSINEHECQAIRNQLFKGKLGERGWVHDKQGKLTKVFIGLGQKDEVTALIHAVGHLPAGCYLIPRSLSDYGLLMWSLAQYQFDRYKKNQFEAKILVLEEKIRPRIQAEAEAVFLVRDLINTPANDMGPAQLADVLESLAHTHQAEFQQWIGEELLTANFPAIHAVGRASHTPPRLLSLAWGDPTHPKVALIGKGVCFDSGGLDLKTSPHMRLMKKDMGGAAQVIGLAKLLMMHNVPIRLQVLIPAVENAIGSNAYRPGDVLTMRNGLTVEIDNTDAEGRLVVADALVKACEGEPELIVDFTTLTGAARIAVGTEISAMFSNHDALANALMRSGEKTKDPLWRMPLYQDYNALLDSSIADLSNASSSSYAGAITAALFLQYFIQENIPWVHFDVMAWNIKNKPGKPEGGEAMALRAVADYIKQKYVYSSLP